MTKSVVSIVGCILKVIYRILIGGKCPGCDNKEVTKNETFEGKK